MTNNLFMPGNGPSDAHDVHIALDAIQHDLEARHAGRTQARVLMGYSLGAFHTFYIAAADEDPEQRLIGFDRYVTLDAPVRLLHAVEELDSFYGVPLELPEEERPRWVSDLLRGDLGRSFHDRRPVAQKISERIGITLTLNALALAATLLIAVPLGTAAALRPGSAWDRIGAGGTYLLYAVPLFWAGLLLQIFFSVRLGWFPLAGVRSPDAESLSGLSALADRAAHLVLPVVCLGYSGLAYVSRFVRATLIENEAGESWRAARARGLSLFGVLYRHGFRQAGVPLLTLAGFLLPALVGGSVIVEMVFAVPGVGRLFVDAVFQRDVPVVMGLTLLSGAATLVGIVLLILFIHSQPQRSRAVFSWSEVSVHRSTIIAITR